MACIIGSYDEDADTLHVGFLSTNESVRQQLLEITPAGTPFRTVLTFTEKETRGHEPSILPLVQTQPAYRYHFANRRGEVDSIERLGFKASYRVLFGLTTYSVKAEYGFDESNRLVDLVVYVIAFNE
ncbi:MAG: hypothetical protein WAM44_04600 [Chthoniobacterales bacterium]